MPIILDGTAGIDNNATDLSYTGTLTGGTGVVNLGSGQLFKDASGNVGIGTSSPSFKLHVSGSATQTLLVTSTAGDVRLGLDNSGASYSWIDSYRASGAMAFATSNTERARITAAGAFLVGTTSGTVDSSNKGFAISSDGEVKLSRLVGGSSPVFDAYGSQGIARVLGNGNLQNTNNSYGSISDVKLKENVTDVASKLDKLAQVRVVNYNLKTNPDQKLLGVIAQELEQIFPGMVEETTDRDAEGNDLGTVTKAVKYSVFVPMLIKGLQELKAINDAQAQTIESLTARVVALENQIV